MATSEQIRGQERGCRTDPLGLAHDLRNQLTLAALAFQRLDLPGGKQADHGRAVESALGEARELCRCLLDPGAEPRRRVLLRQLLERELEAALTLSGRDRELRLELRCPRELEAELRQLALARCVRNLVLNALEATPGAGAVRVEARAVGEGDVRVEVIDEGHGMSPEQLERCFRGRESGRQGGTGLGTTSLLDCVEQLGAELEVISIEGRGTRARITLRGVRGEAPPLVMLVDPDQPVASDSDVPRADDGRLRVLDATTAAALLQRAGARAVIAARSLPATERGQLAALCRENGLSYSEVGALDVAVRESNSN